MLLTAQCLLCLVGGLSSAAGRDGWVADQETQLGSDSWPGKGWTQVVELQDTRHAKKWNKLGKLSSPEVFGNEEESPSNGDKVNRVKDKAGGSDVNQISKGTKALPEKDKDIATGGIDRVENTLTTVAVKDILGPGMGGSAVQGIADNRVQKFATEPAPQTAVVGSIVVLPCRVVNKVGQLQWTKDGFGLGTERSLFGFSRYSMIGADDEGDFSLRIQPVLLEDDGFFQCQVSASDGVPGIRTKTVHLQVYVPPDPPVIRPKVLDSTAGLLTTIECTSKGGKPPPEILWVDERHPREPLGLGAETTMKQMSDNKRVIVTSKLSFTPRRTHDNATISCLTTHQALTSPLSSSVRLRIRYAPEVQVAVTPERLVEADDARLSCSAVANPPKLTYRWYHNRMVVENQTSPTLLLHKISRAMHQDTISCEVSNEVGTSKKTQSLLVRFGPVFKSVPQDAAAEMQNEVLLKCDVESNPPPSIVWLQDGSEKVIGTGPELRVVVGPSTTGSYRCVASVRDRDLQFPDLVGRMRVLVKGPPTIVSAGEQLGTPGGTVTLECNTVSVPSPIKVTWTYKGRAIDIEDPRYEVREQQRDGGLKTILVIHDADQTDFGDYNCSVVNEYGVARKLIRLNEEKRCAAVAGHRGWRCTPVHHCRRHFTSALQQEKLQRESAR
ncbi:irregular chiasm C-roughest protein [Hyalella azteca]|uniref:Irregular chiasm C-roughest protein n=1 Tax=Hyalella azteca TaxID=294128 RepID=A0A979FM63_HYAAZ|nr:irregular chiasm C-roughest protein [Hyalella azteca]